MAVLDEPLSWTTATGEAADLLDSLQPNIVKGHVREHLTVLFLRFDDAAEAADLLRSLVPLMKSARTHLEEIEAHRATGAAGSPYVGVGLTRHGYDVLGTAAPADVAFSRGMRDPATRTALLDPPVSTWDETYREQIDAVVLIGDATDAGVAVRRQEVEALLTDGITVLGEETGLGQHNANSDGIEHFGYVDGRSQPLFLTEDIDAERRTTDGVTTWDPAFPLGRVVVPDPAAPDPTRHFGSYFVFRKLEQNVQRFKQAEADLAVQLGLTGEDAERAGAMLVGRFEDGTPLTLERAAGPHDPVMNDFDYDSDDAGRKCPFSAHIRKTNPRGSGGFEAVADERLHLMARRGQTYGVRQDDPGADLPPSARPTGGVGLLFMAFNVDLAQQFEFTQSVWADNPGFPRVPVGSDPPGVDPVIGQGLRPKMTSSREWGGTETAITDAVPQAVRMRGGEYFFMPSLAYLGSL